MRTLTLNRPLIRDRGLISFFEKQQKCAINALMFIQKGKISETMRVTNVQIIMIGNVL